MGFFFFLFCSHVSSVLATIGISNCIFGSVDCLVMYLAFYGVLLLNVHISNPTTPGGYYIQSFDMLTGYSESIV